MKKQIQPTVFAMAYRDRQLRTWAFNNQIPLRQIYRLSRIEHACGLDTRGKTLHCLPSFDAEVKTPSTLIIQIWVKRGGTIRHVPESEVITQSDALEGRQTARLAKKAALTTDQPLTPA